MQTSVDRSPLSSVTVEKLIISQLVKKIKDSLMWSQELVTELYLEPDESSLHPHTLSLNIHLHMYV